MLWQCTSNSLLQQLLCCCQHTFFFCIRHNSTILQLIATVFVLGNQLSFRAIKSKISFIFYFQFNNFWISSLLCVDPAFCQASYSSACRIYLTLSCIIGLLVMNSLSFLFVSHLCEIKNILPVVAECLKMNVVSSSFPISTLRGKIYFPSP